MYISKIFVTVDNVVIRKVDNQFEILLIKRLKEPFMDCWALPGGFVDENEDLETAAKRELLEETSIQVNDVLQIGAYGKPFRDPRSHVVSVAFFAEVDKDVVAKAADDAKDVNWFRINSLPPTAFDHKDIINDVILKFNLL